jgi:hypothetical protein
MATDRLLRGLLVLTLLVCAAGAAPGLYFIGEDAQTRGEFLDGIGIAIGLGILALVAVPAALAGWALRASLLHRSNAPGRALAAGLAGLVLGAPFGIAYRPLLAVLIVPLLLSVVAFEARQQQSR